MSGWAHIIPRGWRDFWPIEIDDPNERLLAEQRREQYVNRLGNLTLATGSLNPAMGNDPWEAKRAELRKHSKLQLNALLIEHEDWDEDRIMARGRWLAEQVERIWPGPADTAWEETGTT